MSRLVVLPAGDVPSWLAGLAEAHGSVELIAAPTDRAADGCVVVGSPADKLAADLGGLSPVELRHPTATFGSDLRLGPGGVFDAEVRVTTNVETGWHLTLGRRSTLSHDCVVGDHVTVGADVNITGNVTIGHRVEIGDGAVLIPGVTIGDDVVIGPGEIVLRDRPD